MNPTESSENLRKSVNRGLAWVGLASSMVGVLDIVATVLIVAFWITKEQMGVAALAISLFPILDLATDLGLAAAIIQRDDHSESRISTIFWLNFAMSLLLFLLLTFGIGPFVAWLQGHPVLTAMLSVYGLKLMWQNTYFLPYALMKRELRFKELSVIRIIANLAEFVGKVGFAAAGFGIWCFVVGPLARVLVTSIGVQICHPWRPRMQFRFREGWDWAKFGLKTSAHKMLFRLYTLLDKQIVGYYFGEAALGVYAIAYQIVLEPALVISEISINVAFPAFARLKNNTSRLYEQLVGFCRMNLVAMLLFVGYIFVAAEEILALFSQQRGNDYSSGAPIIRVLCGVAVLRALSFVIPPFLDGVGRPTLNLIYTSVATVVLTLCFLLCAELLGHDYGSLSVAIGWLIGYPVAFMVLVWMAFAILELPSYKLYARLAGIAGCGIAATGLAALAKWACLDQSLLVRAIVVAVVMFTSYAGLLWRFQGISLRSIRSHL